MSQDKRTNSAGAAKAGRGRDLLGGGVSQPGLEPKPGGFPEWALTPRGGGQDGAAGILRSELGADFPLPKHFPPQSPGSPEGTSAHHWIRSYFSISFLRVTIPEPPNPASRCARARTRPVTTPTAIQDNYGAELVELGVVHLLFVSGSLGTPLCPIRS